MSRYSTVVAVVALAAVLLASEARPFNVTDLVKMPRVQEVATSPKSTKYVVTVNVWDSTTNKKTQTMYLGDYAATDKDLIPLDAQTGTIDSTPVWSVDGNTVFFLSSRGSGIWAIDVTDPANAKAYNVVTLPVDVDTMILSPKGTYMAFTSFVYPGMTLQQTADKDAARAASPVNVQEWTETFVRRWDQYWDGKFSHVHYGKLTYDDSKKQYSMDAKAMIDIMGDQDGDCPQRPFGGVDEYSWSPKETYIGYTTQLGRDKGWSTDTNVWEYTLKSKTRECISCDNKALDTNPVYSSDENTIAYLAMQTPGYESDQKEIRLYDRSTKKISTLEVKDFDRSFESIEYDSTEKFFYCTVEDQGYQKYFRIDIAGHKATVFAGNFTASSLNVIKCVDKDTEDCALFIESQFIQPAEVFMTKASGETVRVTTFTADNMKDIEMTQVWETHYSGWNKEQIQAWVHAPYGYKEGDKNKYPVVLYIHGGPETPWTNNFHYRWNPQLIAAMGYVIIQPNFHGSGSFGKEFTKSILLHWGDRPFEDLMLAVDHLGAKFRFADIENVGAMGASYGGYMINWLNSQTKRFKCLICHDGVFNTAANYWETDELYFPTIEFGGVPTDHDACYAKWSPATYADNMVTPELIFHGGRDYRISEVAGISVFNTLQRNGIDSKLVRYPEENHWVTRPANSITWHAHIEAWLAKYLKKSD